MCEARCVSLSACTVFTPSSPCSHSEFKDFCSVYKGFSKQIIRMASHLSPETALAITAEALLTTLAAEPSAVSSSSGASPAAAIARQQRLEAAVMVAEVRLPWTVIMVHNRSPVSRRSP